MSSFLLVPSASTLCVPNGRHQFNNFTLGEFKYGQVAKSENSRMRVGTPMAISTLELNGEPLQTLREVQR